MDRALAIRHVMQANKGANTTPELVVRSYLRSVGLAGYRLHWKKAAGRPDICYPGRRVAIFVNGCFWHRCPRCALALPRTNIEYWSDKFERNRTRDARNHEELRTQGWTVLVVWECQLKGERAASAMGEIAQVVGAAGQGLPSGRRREGRVVEVGTSSAWQRARSRRRIALARGRR